eukprot:TRINITY_DN7857_c0_g1_i2.p1 TRINITY_DN7857_c0_g1~~TRINITY_DN7857_c0_g1_i2.p1  ORF type:complete len:123 (-),score=16.23 TRINITY_DN7857_c0_g1_i2:360-704(-)
MSSERVLAAVRRLTALRQGQTNRCQRSPLAGVVFDLDGTLTVDGAIDFDAMRRAVGIPSTSDILQHINELPPEEREKANGIIEEIEMRAIEKQELQPVLSIPCPFRAWRLFLSW